MIDANHFSQTVAKKQGLIRSPVSFKHETDKKASWIAIAQRFCLSHLFYSLRWKP